jgi:predicted nucleic acid-binding protein
MTVEAFVDTNVLIYAACGALDFPEKYDRAWEIIARGNYAVSAQVLAEFYVVSTKKKVGGIPLKPSEASTWLDRLSLVTVIAIDDEIVRQAAHHAQQFRISYWDAALIAAAETQNIKILYTEDLNHGQFYGSVQAINPFLTQPSGLQEQ